jgi:hypothetical protein
VTYRVLDSIVLDRIADRERSIVFVLETSVGADLYFIITWFVRLSFLRKINRVE